MCIIIREILKNFTHHAQHLHTKPYPQKQNKQTNNKTWLTYLLAKTLYTIKT